MNFFEKIIHGLSGSMNTPTSFGWFHILSLVLMIAAIVVSLIFRKKLSDKKINIILLVTSITLIVLEIYKQLVFSYDGVTDKWSYQWYAFPFQFCSTPMYVMLLAAIVRKSKFYDLLLSFLGTFSLAAGLMVMIYPNDVFIGTIGINIQTMVTHGAMPAIGFLLWFTGKIKFSLKTVLNAFYVFIVLVAVAQILNIIVHFSIDGVNFNMFFISPYRNTTLPVLNIIQPNVPYFIFLIIYLLGFIFIDFLIVISAIGIKKLYTKLTEKKEVIIEK